MSLVKRPPILIYINNNADEMRRGGEKHLPVFQDNILSFYF